jgi:hypothetical protein
MPDTSEIEFKLWWIPQVPMKPFEVEIASIDEGRKLSTILANYDKFQFENKVKPDYCNVGGISFRHPKVTEGEWWDVPEDQDEWQDVLNELEAVQKEVS